MGAEEWKQQSRQLTILVSGQRIAGESAAVLPKTERQQVLAVRMTVEHLVEHQHPGPKHAGAVAGHVLGEVAVADQMLGGDGEMESFRDPA
jgi:hypothetical protein